MPIAPAPGAQPQQPPFGVSPATGPTPNKGYEAAAAQKLGLILKGMAEILPLVGPSSDIGQALLDAMKKVGKFVPSGSVSPASEKRQIEQMAMRNAQGNQQMQAIKQQAAGGGMGGAPGGAAAGAGGPPPGMAAAA